MKRGDEAALEHARRQLREHYLSDAINNAANVWYEIMARGGWLGPASDVHDADDVVADVVESVLWSSRHDPRRGRAAGKRR